MTTKVGKNLRNVYDTLADVVADSGLRLGEEVQTLGHLSADDGKPLFGRVVAAGTGIADSGYVDLSNGLQFENSMGKFTIGYDNSVNRTFMQIYNWVDGIQIIQFPDGTITGDAHVSFLPPDVRRDSHAYLATAGTLDGENDIDFRTYQYSDYALIRGRTVRGDESLQLLFDTKPQRNDATKKNGTGGGGLSPTDDVYAFDQAMVIPSNRTTDPITFPALPVLFEQYIQIEKRTGANFQLRYTPNTDDVTITDETSGNTLGKFESDGVTLGGRKKYIDTERDIQATNGSHELSFTKAISTGGTETVRLAASGAICSGRLRISAVGSGGSGVGFKEVSFQSDGTTITEQTVVNNLVVEFPVTLALNAGILDLDIGYTGGYGGTGKVQVSIDWDVRTA